MVLSLSFNYQFVAALKAAIALATAALLVWWWYGGRQGQHTPTRWQNAALAILGVLGFLGWWNFGGFAFRSGYAHHYEFFHYYLGSKYASELGYTRLYDCVAAAEVQSGRRFEVSSRWTRDLTTNELRRGSPAVDNPALCLDHFAPGRWDAFTQDVEWFRGRIEPERWLDIQMDHGYNASPVWTAVGSLLTNTGPASVRQIAFLWWLDPLLLIGMWALVWWAFGWRVLCVALVFWGTNQIAKYTYVGGAFLRHDWLVLAIAAICLAKRGRMAASGFALAWSALLRVFPALILMGLVLKIATDAWRDRSLAPKPAHRRFAAGALLALALWVPFSLTVGRSGEDRWATWTAFFQNSRKHAATPLLNNVGMPVAVAFDPANRSELVEAKWIKYPWDVWREKHREILRERRAIYIGLVAGFLILLMLAVRGREDWIVLTLGIGAIPIFIELSNYYYGILIGLAFLWPRVQIAGVGLVCTALLSDLIILPLTANDDRFAAISVTIVLLVFMVCGAFARQSRQPDRVASSSVSSPLDPAAK